MQKIRPFLWFDGKAEEAALFYIGIFKNATLGSVMRYGDAGPGPKGSVMSVTFTIEEREFIALNGSSQFSFTPAISFFVTCENQEEVDTYRERLRDGGNPLQCGWITDKYGVTWQIVPSGLTDIAAGRETGEGDRCHASHDADGQTRHPPASASLRASVAGQSGEAQSGRDPVEPGIAGGESSTAGAS